MKKNSMKPYLRWAGGKTQIVGKIKSIIDENFHQDNTFYEPFVGGGAVFLSLNANKVVINDYNEELINCYRVVKDDLDTLIKLLMEMERAHKKSPNGDFYYEVRKWDRDPDYHFKRSIAERAARLIYLNKSCFNGLYRVNSKGFFNTPIGRPNILKIINEENLKSVSEYLNKSKIKILNGDFEKAIRTAKAGDFIYFDPPYDYNEKGFTQYTITNKKSYSIERLKTVSDKLVERGCKVLISNNDTNKVRQLFSSNHYKIEQIEVQRFISSKISSRKKVSEILIFGHNI